MSSPASSTRRLRLASVNVNGIRAAARKGMSDWLDAAIANVPDLSGACARTSLTMASRLSR